MSETVKNDETGEEAPVAGCVDSEQAEKAQEAVKTEQEDFPEQGDSGTDAQETDTSKQEDSLHSGEPGGVKEALAPVVNGSNGESVTDKTEVEMIPADENNVEQDASSHRSKQQSPPPAVPMDVDDQALVKTEAQELCTDSNHGCKDGADASNSHAEYGADASTSHAQNAEPTVDNIKTEACQVPEGESDGAVVDTVAVSDTAIAMPHAGSSDTKDVNKSGGELENKVNGKDISTPTNNGNPSSKNMFLPDDIHMYDGNESGTEEEQSDFIRVLENFFKERSMEFKPLKFYGDNLNYLKLWRSVMKLGGYDKVTSSKLWRQVGEAFKPPKTCTTVSWTFRGFYEKALLDYEKYKTHGGEISIPIPSQPKPLKVDNKASGSGRTRRDAASRAMQGWHSQRLLGTGEVSEPIIKDKKATALQKQEKQLKTSGSHKRKKPPNVDPMVKEACTKPTKLQVDTDVVDLGPPADWVKVTVQKTKDCFEVYALVPGLLREEVRVQTDPAGRLVISGEPEHADNPWGVTAFKKAISLPSRIDPHHTSAVVTLHGQLFVRVPFEQSEQEQ